MRMCVNVSACVIGKEVRVPERYLTLRELTRRGRERKKGRLKRNCKSVGAGACERMGECERERKRESASVHVGRNEEER